MGRGIFYVGDAQPGSIVRVQVTMMKKLPNFLNGWSILFSLSNSCRHPDGKALLLRPGKKVAYQLFDVLTDGFSLRGCYRRDTLG